MTVRNVKRHLIYRGKSFYDNTIPLTTEEWEKQKDYLIAFNDNFNARDSGNVNSTTVIVGEVEKSDLVDDDEAALMKDITESFNVLVKKPVQKPVPKPTRRSKRIQNREDALTRSSMLSVHSTSKPRTTRNSLHTSTDVKASTIVSNAKKRQGKFNINKFTSQET